MKASYNFRTLFKLGPFLKSHRIYGICSLCLIPLIALFSVLEPMLLKKAIDEGIFLKNTDVLFQYSAFFTLVILSKYLSRSLQSFTTSTVIFRMIKELRLRLVRHILSLKSSFHDKHLSGSLVTTVTNDFDQLSESLKQGSLESLVDIFVFIGSIVGMFLLSWKVSLLLVVLIPVLFFIVYWFSREIKNSLYAARSHLSFLNGFAQECLFGIFTIKTLTSEIFSWEKYQTLNENYRKSQMKSVSLDALLYSVLDGVSSFMIGLFFWVTLSFFKPGTLSVGFVVAFVHYIQQMFTPLKQLGANISMLQGAFTSIERIFQLLEKKEFISGSEELSNFKGNIVFNDVSFSYETEKEDFILNHISFSFNEGSTLALVGKTGCGKSTLVKLLLKLYEGYQGEITIDGLPLSSFSPESLRREIAYVPQDIALFEGSIAFNVALSEDEKALSRVVEACKAVGVHSFIMNLPGQYKYLLKEGGHNLSHGQRQLLALARALASPAKLLILDEATSSIDPETEAQIQKAIRLILKTKSAIVVAHRLSTIRSCDKILVLEEDLITHDELSIFNNPLNIST